MDKQEVFKSTPSTQRETILSMRDILDRRLNPLPLRRGRRRFEEEVIADMRLNPLPLRRGRQGNTDF